MHQPAGHLRTLCLQFGLMAGALLCFLWLAPLALVVDDAPRQAEAIVVLLGAEGPDRIFKAYELYHQNFAPRIVFGTSYIDPQWQVGLPQRMLWPPDCHAYLTALRSLGVPPDAIKQISTSEAYDTAHELSAIADYLRREGWRSALVVTSPMHTRRVSVTWRRVAADIDAQVIASGLENPQKWWTDTRKLRAIVYESAALIKEAWNHL